MAWFRRSRDRHDEQTHRLRRAEQHEEEAMRRMVDAGVRVTMSADDSSEAIDQIIEDIERARADGDRVIRTAQGALRLLERDRRQ